MKRDGIGLAEIAARLGEEGADFRGGAVAVVGQRLDDDGDAARAVALVADLVIGGVVLAAGAALDRAFHRVADMLDWRARNMAARSRGLALGSAWPVLAATVNSRMILVKTLARFASCAPFRVHDVFEL